MICWFADWLIPTCPITYTSPWRICISGTIQQNDTVQYLTTLNIKGSPVLTTQERNTIYIIIWDKILQYLTHHIYMHGIFICITIDCYGPYSHFLCCFHHTTSNLTSIGYDHLLDSSWTWTAYKIIGYWPSVRSIYMAGC